MDMCIGRDDPPASPQDAIGRRVRWLAIAAGARPSDSGFGRMFPGLAGPQHRLPEGAATLEALVALGAGMAEPPPAAPAADPGAPPAGRDAGDGDMPAAYTYLIQFVLNDLVWERTLPADPAPPDFAPLAGLDGLLNRRSGQLDLDSVYDAPRDPAAIDRMLLGPAATPSRSPAGPLRPAPEPAPSIVPGAGPAGRRAGSHDLPRFGASRDPSRDRRPRMADPRNDAVLMLSQLHVAFLKAHNALVAGGLGFEAARRALRRRYQALVLDDLARRLCAGEVHAATRNAPPRPGPGGAGRLLPVEFAAAAFVLAPSLMRARYDMAPRWTDVPRALLSPRIVLGGAGRGPGAVPVDRRIAWERFLPLAARAPQPARRLNTLLAGEPAACAAFATGQLLRGYRLGLPTGQAVARHLGLAPLAGDALLAALPAGQQAAAAPFARATPLWFYVLAEAGDPAGPAGRHLGPVGSRIVADTLWTLARQADGAILGGDGPADFGAFTLCDLVLLAAEQDRAC